MVNESIAHMKTNRITQIWVLCREVRRQRKCLPTPHQSLRASQKSRSRLAGPVTEQDVFDCLAQSPVCREAPISSLPGRARECGFQGEVLRIGSNVQEAQLPLRQTILRYFSGILLCYMIISHLGPIAEEFRLVPCNS